jgi:hypothetical protein
MSGVMPISPSRAGVVSRSSHGDTGDVRKSLELGFKNSGEADSAEAIACAAASSLADIGRAAVELSSGAEDGSEDLLEASIFK